MRRAFILRCRTRGGGFAEKSGGTPFLYATWHAVTALDLLFYMEAHKDILNGSGTKEGLLIT